MNSVCAKCNGTGTEVVPGKGARACVCRLSGPLTRRKKVVDLQDYRAKSVSDRNESNRLLADSIIGRWREGNGGPGGGYGLFNAILQRALKGPLFTPERAK